MRARIVSTTLAVAAIAVLLLAVPLAVAVSALYNEETAQQLLADAVRAAAAVPAPPLEPGDPVEFPATSSGAALAVYAPGGARIAGDGPARADGVTVSALQGKPATASNGGEISVAVPVGAQEHVAGAVRAALPQTAVDARVRGVWLVMAGLGAAALLVAALLALWQAQRLSRPLGALAGVAAQLGDGKLAVRAARSNIGEIDTVARVMNDTAQRLGTVLERERAFSADASHQLRTPLTAMRLRLEGSLSAPGADRDAEVRKAVEEIDRLERSIEDLLRLARDDPGDRRALDTGIVIKEWSAAWDARLRARGRRLEVSLPPEPCIVMVSASALRQMLDVLVDNAVVHGAGTVTLSVRALHGGVAIDVRDEGGGVIDPQRIFERRHSQAGSAGIGLALARSLAEAEQGRLTLIVRGAHPVFRLAFVAEHR